MKKRVLALVLAVVMVFVAFAFAACSDTKKPDDSQGGEAGSSAPQATEDKVKDNTDLDDVKTAGKLVIGVTYFSPMNYFDDEGKLTGFETDFATAVCEKLGVTPEFKEIIWDKKIFELDSKNIDVVWNGMTIKSDLAEQIDFSEAYMANKQVCVIKADKADAYTDIASMAGAAVCAEAGSAGESTANANAGLSEKFLAVSAQSDALKEVKAGTSDIAIIDAVMAYSMVGEDTDFSDLKVLDVFNDSANEEYGLGFRKGSSLTAEINKIMHELAADGTLDQIAKKYGLESRVLIGA